MATTNPAQQMTHDIHALQSRVGDLQDRVRLNDALGAISDLNTTVTGLPQRITALRTRGYVFEKDMEPQAQAMIASWALLYPNLQTQINQQTGMLIGSLRPIEMQMPQLTALAASPAAAGGLLGTVQSSVSMLEDKISAAEKTVSGMYDQFGDQVTHFKDHLDEIEYMVKDSGAETIVCQDTNFCYVKEIFQKTGLKRAIVTNLADLLPTWKKGLGVLFDRIPGGKVDKDNRQQVDQAIHRVVRVHYKDCPPTWKEVKRMIAEDEGAFVQRLK